MSIKTFQTSSGISVFFPPDVHYKCLACGSCCSYWNIHIDPKTFKNLQQSPLYQKRKEENGGEDLFLLLPNGNECIMRKVNDTCVFLMENNLCEIHAEMGKESKALACRQYPIMLFPTPDGVFVDVSFACPAVRQNAGPPLEEQFPDVEGWLREYNYNSFGMTASTLAEDITISWEGYKVIEEFAYRLLDTEKDLGEALWKIFMTLITLFFVCRQKAIKEPTDADLRNFLASTMTTFAFDRDPDYLQQEAEYATFLVAMNESSEPGDRERILEILLTGGNLHSRTFNTDINGAKLQQYAKSHPEPWKDRVLERYIRQLLWQKFPLKTSNIIGGIALFNILYPYYEWYLYAAALARNAGEPEERDALEALRIIECSVKHDNTGYVERCTQSFCESITRQVGIYFQPDH